MTSVKQPKLPEVLLIGCQGSGKTVLAAMLKSTESPERSVALA
jgi:signal recognition particle GTPase